MYTLNITKAIKKMSVNFINENYYKQIEFSKEDSYRSLKRSKKKKKKKELLLFENRLIEKVPHTRNAKRSYESFLKKKNRKSVKQ